MNRAQATVFVVDAAQEARIGLSYLLAAAGYQVRVFESAKRVLEEPNAEIPGCLLHDGLPAAVASAATRPQLNDLIIEGSLLSVQQGSAAARVTIGFSAGESEMKVAVEGFQMTASGLRKLGSGDIGSTGSKTPGSAVGLASLLVTHNPAGFIVSTGMKVYGEKSGSNTIEGRDKQIAQKIGGALKMRFQQEGWISSAS